MKEIRPSTLSAVVAVAALLIASLRSAWGDDNSPEDQVYHHGVVAADHLLASQAGVEILKAGGNVVDAAVATGFALSVVSPASSGIGGGGFMVIWNAETQSAVTIDYREKAPASASREMYLEARNNGLGDDVSRRGHLAVAVPGHVAGLCYANKHYGRLDLKIVLQPAIRLAREGIPVSQYGPADQVHGQSPFWSDTLNEKSYGNLYRLYLNSGQPWEKTGRFHSPQLKALEQIAEHGAAGFYEGSVADAIVEEMKRGGGLITHADLKAMQPVVREPLMGDYGEGKIIAMPPASSGGVALIEMLNILRQVENSLLHHSLQELTHNSTEYLHVLTEAMKHAFADRAEFLGDADFADVPIARLTSDKYANILAERISLKSTKPLSDYGRYLPTEDGGTTHFSVMDAAGNAVACTETINTGFGSYVVEPRFGIVLNNEMDDFAAFPGEPNVFGLKQSEANTVAPGKKPLSSMSPTIIVEDGRAKLAVGASGGPRIISSTLQVLLNITRFGMQPTEAIAAPRMHHQWIPNELYLEGDLYEKQHDKLETYGHVVTRRDNLAASQAVSRDKDRVLRGASDPRKGGKAAGY